MKFVDFSRFHLFLHFFSGKLTTWVRKRQRNLRKLKLPPPPPDQAIPKKLKKRNAEEENVRNLLRTKRIRSVLKNARRRSSPIRREDRNALTMLEIC